MICSKILSANQPRQVNERNEAPWAPVSYHIPDDEDRHGPRNVGFLYSSDAADSPRRFYFTEESFPRD
jgi:hypothetical protein